MAVLISDFSGRAGLVERYQGDLNDTASQPNLRYLGSDGQYADGIFNPFKVYGYMSPANAKFATLTGTIASPINAIAYDANNDVTYLSEGGENILQLAGLDDTSLSNYLSITSGSIIRDMVMYELNGNKAIFYIADSQDTLVSGGDGVTIGYSMIDTTKGAQLLDTAVTSESSVNYPLLVDTASVSMGSSKARRLSQAFSSSSLAALDLSGVNLTLSRELGTGSGITLKVSIQANSTASAGSFTSRGAWSNAVTDYAINDTVTNGGYTWQCIQAHSAAATTNDEPGVGSAWGDYWNRFGAPTGTALTSQTFDLDDIGNYDTTNNVRLSIVFSSKITLTTATTYWVVIEEVGSNMTSGDQLGWLATVNDAGTYAQQAKIYDDTNSFWRDLNINGDILTSEHDNFDVEFILNGNEFWSKDIAVGSFTYDTGLNETFLYLADNGLLYWFTDKTVNTIDGSVTGGPLGKINQSVLRFPSYVSVTDVAETRSRMYMGVQTSDITSTGDDRTFVAGRSGVFVWDRSSQILGGTDFYPTPGAREIKKVFQSSDGSVKAITLGNSGFTEIRGVSGNQYAVLHTLDKGAYPNSRRAVSQIDQTSVWLGANGIFYAYGSLSPGEKEALYKIGDMSGEANAGLVTGPIYVGHEESSEPRSAIIFGWSDSDPSYVVQKWYPNGDGTIATVAQTGNAGNVYSLVHLLPNLSTVNDITIRCAPTASTGSTIIATVKYYYNQSSTASVTKSITLDEASRGYIRHQLGKANVNSLQIEIEFATDITLGTDSFAPYTAVIDYTPTNSTTKDNG